MTKTELVEALAEGLGLSKAEAQRTLETTLLKITDGLLRDSRVQIQGFGTFTAKLRKERMGRNPQTKEPIKIPASMTVTFRPGQELKKKL
ncbi:MAG: HU family DNA-binding protein [Planctomycetota bacterium]